MSSVGTLGSERWLKNAIENMTAEFDVVLLDCAPSIDDIVLNALVAADKVVMVSQSQMFSFSGMLQLTEFVSQVRTYYNNDLRVGGVIVNQHQANTLDGKEWSNNIEDWAKKSHIPVLTPYLPHKAAIRRTVSKSLGLDEMSGNRLIEDIFDGYVERLLGDGNNQEGEE
jgi:chromosome partitioning protein